MKILCPLPERVRGFYASLLIRHGEGLAVGLGRFRFILPGFLNADLVARVAKLTGMAYSSRQATYDLCRLRRQGLIARVAGTFRYQLTPLGHRVAVIFVKTYGRVLGPGLALCDLALPDSVAQRHPLVLAWRKLDRTIDDYIDRSLAAAA